MIGSVSPGVPIVSRGTSLTVQPLGGKGTITGSCGAVAVAQLLQAVSIAGTLPAATLVRGISIAARPAKVAAVTIGPVCVPRRKGVKLNRRGAAERYRCMKQ